MIEEAARARPSLPPPNVMRVVNELTEMSDRVDRLAKFMGTEVARKLPSDELQLLCHQATGMSIYVRALTGRLELMTKRR